MSKEPLPVKARRRKALSSALVLLITILSPFSQAQSQESASRFTGTWTGTQRWKVDSPSPQTREGQTVSLMISTLGGKTSGTMTPFLGGEEGATFIDAHIVGNQLRATAVIGSPRASNDPANWKDSVEIVFVFAPDGNDLAGSANLTMGNVPWLKLEYRLSRQ